MKLRVTLAIALAAILLMMGAPFVPMRSTSRGVRVLQQPEPPEPGFDPSQSAALFIGVRKFTRDENALDVPYAADDAVDLAYMFTLDRRVALVTPSRVVIALSGRPQKEESKKRLEALRDAGATLEKTEPSDILMLLQQQAAMAGKNGMLIVSIATHGFVRNGVPYILGSTSLFQYPETALPATKLFDIASTSEARRSLFFIDACRERISGDARAGASPVTAAPLVSRMGRVNGQVVFYAAAAGGYAYDDDGNGVFTKAVLDGLNCKAAFARGAVTIDTLRTFVERYVRTWIRQHRNATIGAATQVSMDGDAKNMPLSFCVGPPPPAPPGDVVRATYEGSYVTAFAANGLRLWSREVNGRISRIEIADLRGDGSHEVVIGTNTLIKVLDRAGANIWSVGESMMLRTFLVGHLLRHDPTLQITALWNDEDESRSSVSTYDANGQRLSTYSHSGNLQHIAIDRPTSRHNRKIIAIGTDADAGAIFGMHKPLASVLVLDTNSKLLWKGVLFPPAERVARFEVANRDKYSRDITLSTAAGDEIHLDFEGNVLSKSSPHVTLKILPRNARHTHTRASSRT
jgi:hypothetical protein